VVSNNENLAFLHSTDKEKEKISFAMVMGLGNWTSIITAKT